MVKNIVSTLLIVSTLAAGTPAFAAPNIGTNQDVGFITEVNQTDKTVTLADGTTYQLPYGYDTETLNAGQKVMVSWDQVGGSVLARSVVFTN